MRLLHYSDVENVYDDAERAGRLAGTLRALAGPDALVVGTGDDTAPGVVPLIARGRQALDFFHAAGTDVETFGNHDFDYGPDATRGIVADSPQTWVSANARDEDGDRFGQAEGVVPWTVESADGRRVGFVGVTDPATDSLNPMAADLSFTDPVEAAAAAIDDLRDEGVDHVVALSHLGAGDDDLARALDLDVVLGGHVHTRRIEHVDGTLCTRPGVNGHAVVEVAFGGNDAGDATGNDDGADDADADGDADGDDDRPAARFVDPAEGPVHEELAAALRERREAAGLTEVVAEVSEPMARTREATFGGESRLGNFVADAYRWAAAADVGLQNGGGIREGEPLAGEVTTADLVSVLPFEEPVVLVELTGEELRQVVREADGGRLDFGEDDWWHAHVSGAEVVWDRAAGEVVELRVGGEPVDPERLYRVATSEYLLHSDHEFPTMDEHHRAGEAGIQHEVLADYAREFGLDNGLDGRVRFVE